MSLGFTKSSNVDFLPSLRFNAVSGDCIVAGSTKNADGQTWDKYEKDVKFPAKFVADLENIEVGWLLFSSNGPDFRLSKIGTQMPERPSEKHKQGFRLKLFSKEFGLVSMANSSNTVKDVLNDIHDAYLADKDNHKDKMPVLEFKGIEKIVIKTKEGAKNYKKPIIVISGWVAKPDAMKEAEKVSETTASEPTIDQDDEF